MVDVRAETPKKNKTDDPQSIPEHAEITIEEPNKNAEDALLTPTPTTTTTDDDASKPLTENIENNSNAVNTSNGLLTTTQPSD